MLQLFRRGFALLRLQRDEEADNHPGQGGMHARFQYRRPQNHPHQHIDANPTNVEDIQQRQCRNGRRCDTQRQHRQFAGIEQGNDDNCAQIVNDSQRHQKDF